MRRMTKAGQGLVAAMEAEADVIAENQEEIGNNAESLETDMLEVADSAEEGAVADEKQEEAAEVVEALESMAVSLGLAAKNGGIDAHAADALGVALEHMYSRVGLKSKPMPVLESFGGTSSRVGATQLAMEGIKEQAKKIWDAIVAAIKSAIAWLGTFYNKIFDAATKLKSRAESLEEKAQAVHGQAKEKTFENANLVKALNVAGKIPTGAALTTDLLATAKSVFGSGKEILAYAEGFLKLADKESPQKTFLAEFSLPAASMKNVSVVSNPGSLGFTDAKEGFAVYRTKELPGGKAVVAYAPTAALSGQAAVDAIGAISSEVSAFNPKAVEPTEKVLPTLQSNDAVSVAKAVAQLAADCIGFKAAQAEGSAILSKVAAAADKAAKGAEKADEADTAGFGAMKRVAQRIPKSVAQPAVAFSKYAIGTGKSLLDYVEESLKQY